MLKVGIYTPYVKNEIALAAVQFADWLVRCGLDVELLSDGKVDAGIHSVWDRKVRRADSNTAVFQWAYGATHLCWFTPNTWAYETSRVVARDTPRKLTKTVFFPHWCNWTEHHANFFRVAHRTICLSQDLAHWLDAKYPDIQTNRTWANLVSPSVPLMPKQGFVEPGSRRLLILLDQSTVLDIGPTVFDPFEFLLAEHPYLEITFAFLGALPKGYKNVVRTLKYQYGERINFAGNPSYPSYIHLTRQHDWVYFAATRHRLGSLLSHLQVTTVPILCHDVPPVGGHLTDAATGKLVPCGIHERPVPVADVDMQEVGLALDEMLTRDEAHLMDMQSAIASHLRKKQDSFEKFIMKEFVL